MEMNNLNRDLEDYKLNELFDLAAWLHGEEFPSPVIVQKKKGGGGNDCKPVVGGKKRDYLDARGQREKKNASKNGRTREGERCRVGK